MSIQNLIKKSRLVKLLQIENLKCIKVRKKDWFIARAYTMGWHNGSHSKIVHYLSPFRKNTNVEMYNEFIRGYRAATAYMGFVNNG